MNVRRAQITDIEQIVKLLYQVQKVHSDKRPDLFIPGKKIYTAEELIQIIPNDKRPIFVADENGVVLGYAFCIFQHNGSNSMQTFDTLYIDDLCVDKNARGKKIGSAIYNYVVDFAKKSGCYNLTLNVWACNENAQKFYKKCGLKVQKYGMETIL